MLVYESGAVKMQLGDVLFDVLPGTEAAIRQDIAAVSAADQACVFLGGVQQRAVACPDIGHLLRCIPDPFHAHSHRMSLALQAAFCHPGACSAISDLLSQ